MEVYEVTWSIYNDDDRLSSGNRLFSTELAQRRFEGELMAAVKLLQLDSYFTVDTRKHVVEA